MSQYQYVEDVEVCLDNYEIYHSKEEVLERIQENENIIRQHRQKLFGLVCSNNPRSLLYVNTEESETPLDALSDRFNAMFDDEFCGIITLTAHNVRLRYIYDNFEKAKIE